MKDRTLEEFLAAVAAPTPTPGGGSVSALAGALSVALSRMVAGLARGKKGYESVESELVQLEGRAKKTQARLEALIDEDAKAYDAVMAAMRSPKSTDQEKAARVEAMQRAYRRATEVPLETMEREPRGRHRCGRRSPPSGVGDPRGQFELLNQPRIDPRRSVPHPSRSPCGESLKTRRRDRP